MAAAGDVLQGPNGYELHLVSVEPERLEMEARYPGDGAMPPSHLHPAQTEHFEVLDGAVRTIVDGAERVYSAGESFTVAPGTPHQMTGQGPARMRWVVTPALRTAEFFETLYSGRPGADFLERFAAEFRLA